MKTFCAVHGAKLIKLNPNDVLVMSSLAILDYLVLTIAEPVNFLEQHCSIIISYI